MKNKRVVIFAPWMPEYRVKFYENLVELGRQSNVDYIILSSPPPKFASGRNDNVTNLNFVKYIKALNFEIGSRSVEIQNFCYAFMKADFFVLEHSIRSLMMYFVLIFRRRKLIFWGHSRTYTKKKSFIEERFKLLIARRAKLYLVYTEEGKNFLILNGLDPSRVQVVQNSTDIHRFDVPEHSLNSPTSEALLSRIEFTPPTCIFLGSLVDEKRLDILIACAHEIKKSVSDFSLLIFGDGPLRNFVISEQTSWIRYGGRATSDILKACSQNSKLILNPGLTGLVAVDSFALGLPLVTTMWKFHAPEFYYLENNVNSVITDPTIESYSNAVIQILQNPEDLSRLRQQCLVEAKSFGVENMARNFHNGVTRTLSENTW